MIIDDKIKKKQHNARAVGKSLECYSSYNFKTGKRPFNKSFSDAVNDPEMSDFSIVDWSETKDTTSDSDKIYTEEKNEQ